MNLCAVVCEYDPFHNGHLYQIEKIRSSEDVDGVIAIMSGSYTQRGEIAALDKFTRAKEAVLAGADCVLELPVPFAVSSAERFGYGAVKLLSAIPSVKTLSFGMETNDKSALLSLAKLFLNEPDALKSAIKKHVDDGLSLVKARELAMREQYPELDPALYTSPNNVLALEYVKACLRLENGFSFMPIKRLGAKHNGEKVGAFASASYIRKEVLKGTDLTDVVPAWTARDLLLCLNAGAYEKEDAMRYLALLRTEREKLKQVPDCTEGLENALKKAINEAFTTRAVVEKLTSPRYTSARVRRITALNMLGVYESDVKEYLSSPLYLSVLAVKEDVSKAVLSALAESGLPVLTRKGDEERLPMSARKCFSVTERADAIYSALAGRKINPYATIFVKTE